MNNSRKKKRIVPGKNVLKRMGICLLGAVLLVATPGMAQAGTELSKGERRLIFYGRVKANDNSKPSCMESEGWNHIKKFDLAPYGLDGSLSFFSWNVLSCVVKKDQKLRGAGRRRECCAEKGNENDCDEGCQQAVRQELYL